MMSRRGAAIVFATAAVVFAACSSGGASSAPSSAASARTGVRGTVGRRAGIAVSRRSRDRLVPHPEQRPGQEPCGRTWPTSTRRPIPNVKINLTVLENEAFKTKLTTLLQAGTPPDLFQSWGGGGLREQQKAGLVKDISADVSSWASEINPGALGHVPGRRQAVRHPVRPRHGRLLVQQGPVRHGRDHDPAGDLGRPPGRRREAQGREA